MARVAAEKFGKIFLLPRDIGPSQTFILVEGLGKLARVGELRELFRPWEWGTPGLHLQGRRELMAYAGLLSLEACSVTEQRQGVKRPAKDIAARICLDAAPSGLPVLRQINSPKRSP